LQQLKVIIIESSEPVVNRIRCILQELPGVLLAGTVATAAEAAVVFDAILPDVILVSIDLPAKNMMMLLGELRQRNSGTKMILLSNRSDAYYKKLCLDSGADYFFDKSTEFEKIPDVLAALAQPHPVN